MVFKDEGDGSMEKNYGSIELESGYTFCWTRGGGDGEIFGWMEKNGGMVGGGSGWYRTTVPATAAKYASLLKCA